MPEQQLSTPADYITSIISTAEASGRFSPQVAEFLRATLPAACLEMDALRGVFGPPAALCALTEFTAMFAGWTITGCGENSEEAFARLDIWCENVKELLRKTL